MGINVYWDDPGKTILVVAYADPWTWEDYYAATEEIDRKIYQAKAVPVGIISDFTHSRSIPAQALTHFRQSASVMAANDGPTIFMMVDIKGIWQAVAMIMSRLYPKAAEKVCYAGSLETARKLLKDREVVHTS